MKINLYNDLTKRITTSLILITLLIGLFFIGNIGIYMMLLVLSFFSFLEIYNLTVMKIKLHIYIPLIIISYLFISMFEIFNLTDQDLLLFFYILSSSLIIISLFQKSNIHFSIVGFLLNSTIFSIIHITSNQILEYKLIYMIVTIISLCDTFAYLIGKRFGKFKIFPNISPIRLNKVYLTFFKFLRFYVIFPHNCVVFSEV